MSKFEYLIYRSAHPLRLYRHAQLLRLRMRTVSRHIKTATFDPVGCLRVTGIIAARVTVVDQSVCLSFCLSVTTIPSWHRYCKITHKQPADNTRSDGTVRNRIACYFATAL